MSGLSLSVIGSLPLFASIAKHARLEAHQCLCWRGSTSLCGCASTLQFDPSLKVGLSKTQPCIPYFSITPAILQERAWLLYLCFTPVEHRASGGLAFKVYP